MNARLEAVKDIAKRTRSKSEFTQINDSARFCSRVFHRGLIEALPQEAGQNWLDVIDGKGMYNSKYGDIIAEALKKWAIDHGATHFTHWFQPLTNAPAEKHDSFLQWGPNGTILESFSGKDLSRGEPDASSFPSGGLRTTHEARGYTAWDPTSYPFLWEGGDGMTLCIPSIFFSWKGEALDHKIPLLRSEEKLNIVLMKLFKLFNEKANRIYATLGPEQEYFLIDRSLYLLRPDLLLANRAVFGAKPPKGQELEDHYFGPLTDRVMAFMRELEDSALCLGIPVKTRHNEVSPAQHEVAPLFERASLAVDHNILLMQLMRRIAIKHDLACILHEKPFQGLNGSGKHLNWSLSTDEGKNLLDPNENSLIFITLLTAIIRAMHQEAALLRASIGSSGNDRRLGGAEAPPTVLSVYLGNELEQIIQGIIHDKKGMLTPNSIDLKLRTTPRYLVDTSDRNRTSFFAFTGNKFEFRAVGASAACALPISVINAIVADSLELILDEIGNAIGDQKLEGSALFKAVLPVLKKHLSQSQAVIFSGNNYSEEWEKEAEKRGLPNIRKSYYAFQQFLDKKAIRAFSGILTEDELKSRYEILVEQYVKTVNIEVNLMVELFQTQILPATQKDFIQRQMKSPLVEEAINLVREIKKLQEQSSDMGWEAKGKVFCDLLIPKMDALRGKVDELEMLVDNTLWPLPKYRELLFLI